MPETIGHKQLVVWKNAMDLLPDIYAVAASLPKEERYGLSDQMRRAVISIAANIAEGHGRNGKKEFIHFLGISQGSTSELDTLIDAAVRLKYIGRDVSAPISENIARIRRLLFGLIRSLRMATECPN